jgi:hypothetical protein
LTLIPEETIRSNAQLVIDTFRSRSDLGERFGYNRESVAWVERFIEGERLRSDLSTDALTKLIQIIASYLGECVIHNYGGEWRYSEGTWGVFFDDLNAVFPFNTVQKQFEHGIDGGKSIVTFFDLIGPIVLRRKS